LNYLEVVDITLDHLDLVEEFCKKCNDLDWVNNATPEAMHFEDTIQEGGGWCGIIKDNNLISIAGYHAIPEVSDHAWRVFYRSATLPEGNNKTLHRGTSPRGKSYINRFIKLLPDKDLVVTSNIENNNYANITRYHRALLIESKMKNSIIEHVKDMEYKLCMQSVWRINIERFKQLYT